MAKNKLVRSDNYNAHKTRAMKEKSALRRERAKVEEQDPTLRVKRLRENVPVTIDQKRYYDPSRSTDSRTQTTQTDSSLVKAESAAEEGSDEEGSDVKPTVAATAGAVAGESSGRTTEGGMRTLITTSPNPTRVSYHFLTILQTIFPLSDTIRRGTGKYTVQDIARYASRRGYSNLVLINEDRKSVNAINFIRLPDGPTAYFTITNLQLKQLATHTTHHPELLLNNFSTSLGHQIASVFRSLFPAVPHLRGRQTVTLHNSRDFVFFRRHRYMFTGAGDRVRLQEIGPRFTLKCREVVQGVGREGDVVWASDAGLESDRKRMFL
ncbi:Brix domain-containing protein C4F8.04 [Taphrina deformans PYCC 5710]|uniref:Brix domain-containing protein C4F8.04 n=1 Tax=Taphrina deformans (strain PYCC 5710 / ATCC 11124 / CBS 356.35 / IMI 108563 / JCM 9778 / NBRC 8474) TaxID=1097556 RepID=R4XBB8_TAPDE|nr:Brix domain-containing protein C4F8.04 [Taphrina deformans PYCC 5710]|eukprot:CCG82895.1 Brix domain-containing protein C4F8.04 [Taphrina deformans PYCC 5710]